MISTEILKHGQASDAAIRLAKDLSCESCKARIKPHVPLPAQTGRVTQFSEQVGLDMKYLPGWRPNQKIKSLNMVDQSSCFQQVVPFYETETSALLRKLYATHWVAWAGPPKELIPDPAQTTLGENLQWKLNVQQFVRSQLRHTGNLVGYLLGS